MAGVSAKVALTGECNRCCYHNGVTKSAKTAERPDAETDAKTDAKKRSDKGIETVFLDRDGVINQKLPEGEYVSSWERFVLLPGVAEAIVALKQAGKRVIVVTNQRGVALGRYTAEDVDAIHARLQALLAERGAQVDAFYLCPHDKKQCQCRKPLPGMFEQARAQFPQIAAASSVMVGDSLSDIEFGQAVGMRTLFIEGDTEHRKPGWERGAELADAMAANLPDAVRQILD